jgi:hypothetical protein
VCETAPAASDLHDADEIFAVTPHGIASVSEAGRDGRALSHSLAATLLNAMKAAR